jgi:hypothetical protein
VSGEEQDLLRSRKRIESAQIEESQERVEPGMQRTTKGSEIASPTPGSVFNRFKKIVGKPQKAAKAVAACLVPGWVLSRGHSRTVAEATVDVAQRLDD